MFEDHQQQQCSVLFLPQISYGTQPTWQWNLIKHRLKLCLWCRHSNRDSRKKTVQSQCFLQTKESQFLVANGPITLIILINLRAVSWEVRWVKWFQSVQCLHSWTLNFIGPFATNLENLLFSEIAVIGQSSFKCPGLSVRTERQISPHA